MAEVGAAAGTVDLSPGTQKNEQIRYIMDTPSMSDILSAGRTILISIDRRNYAEYRKKWPTRFPEDILVTLLFGGPASVDSQCS